MSGSGPTHEPPRCPCISLHSYKSHLGLNHRTQLDTMSTLARGLAREHKTPFWVTAWILISSILVIWDVGYCELKGLKSDRMGAQGWTACILPALTCAFITPPSTDSRPCSPLVQACHDRIHSTEANIIGYGREYEHLSSKRHMFPQDWPQLTISCI